MVVEAGLAIPHEHEPLTAAPLSKALDDVAPRTPALVAVHHPLVRDSHLGCPAEEQHDTSARRIMYPHWMQHLGTNPLESAYLFFWRRMGVSCDQPCSSASRLPRAVPAAILTSFTTILFFSHFSRMLRGRGSHSVLRCGRRTTTPTGVAGSGSPALDVLTSMPRAPSATCPVDEKITPANSFLVRLPSPPSRGASLVTRGRKRSCR